jgi:hypothetical protein
MTRRQSLLTWALCCACAGLAFVVYYGLGQSAGRGVLMPLDDAYIHFQYARQLAAGQPYAYNPGLPPTSGATSFLYPFVLAAGVLAGFREQALGLWAMLVGALALAGSGFALARFARAAGAPLWLAGLAGAGFALSGAAAWHAASGMETLLITAFTLGLLAALAERRRGAALALAALCALTRPEGAAAAGAAVLVLAGDALALQPAGPVARRAAALIRRPCAWLMLLLPLLAAGVQPLVNALVTGSAVASGNAAKSVFGAIPFSLPEALGRVAGQFARMWREWALPPDALWIVGPLLAALALVGVLALVRARRWRELVFLGLTLGVTSALISTLDTAFWHFRRYQMPLAALCWALAAVGAFALARWRPGRALALGALLVTVGVSWSFLTAYSANVGYVAAQPYPMARWLAANAPADAVIAVHDVGAMRYFGGRTTLDIVGLTTPGAADYWRNGPGSVGEFIERARPDLIASYGEGHGLGLGFLAVTDLYAQTLAEFPVAVDPALNVALAAPVQGIYRPDYAAADAAQQPRALLAGALPLPQLTLLAALDVADLASERVFDYAWSAAGPPGGFPTEYYEFTTIGCVQPCTGMDGGRRITGAEQFTLPAQPGQDVLLITRLHGASAGRYQVWVDGALLAERVIPALPGAWLEVPVLIPAGRITDDRVRVEIRPLAGAAYMPYYHWAYAVRMPVLMAAAAPVATYQQGAAALEAADVQRDGAQLRVTLTWVAPLAGRLPQGDAKVFIHVLDAAEAIVAQSDARPGGGALPPGNWIPGRFSETITLDVGTLAPGRYRVALGLYDPDSGARWLPDDASLGDRLFVGEFALD